VALEEIGLPTGRLIKDDHGNVIGQGFTPYSLRHHRATSWIVAGHNLAIIAEAMGPSVEVLLSTHKHLTSEHLQQLVEDPQGGVRIPSEMHLLSG
jgi:site-specific recombinase XerD